MRYAGCSWRLAWFCLSLVLAGFGGSLPAQNVATFQHLNKRDGLSQGSVFAIAQDSTGYFWFGTRDGLNRYDGHDFHVFREDSTSRGPYGNDVRALAFDAEGGKLWVGTTTGLSRYDPVTERFEHFDCAGGQGHPVWAIHVGQGGQVMVGTGNGAYIYDPELQTLRQLTIASPELGSQVVNTVYAGSRDRLWFGTDAGLFVLEPGGAQTLLPVALPGTNLHTAPEIRALAEDAAGQLYVGTARAGLLRFTPGLRDARWWRDVAGPDTEALPNAQIRALHIDGSGGLWIGTFDGLAWLDLSDGHVETYLHKETGQDELSNNSIRSLYVDERGGVWIGTYYGGVNHLDERYERFRNYRHLAGVNSLSANVISSFDEDSLGNLFIGTEGGGINRLDRETGRFTAYSHDPSDSTSLSGPNVKEVLVDGDFVWAGTFNAGLNRLDTRTGTIRRYRASATDSNTLSHNNVYALATFDERLWIGTYGGGLNVLDPATGHFRRYHPWVDSSPTVPADQIRVLYEDRRGTRWLGTESGLIRVEIDSEGLPKRFVPVVEGMRIYCLYADAKDGLWVGTLGRGLFRYDLKSGAVAHIDPAQGLPGNTVYGILADDDQHLWLSTNFGLARYDPVSEQFTVFDHASGLRTQEFNFGAYYHTRGGELLFGGIDGFTRFTPADIVANPVVPNMAFTELRQNGRPLRMDARGPLILSVNHLEQLTLPYGEANVSIAFAALDFYSPESTPYSYTLEGLDREWTNGFGKGLATYTLQREGDYLLRVRGANGDGVWNPVERQLQITVLPPWWRTGWAYLAYALLAAGAVLAGVRYLRLHQSLQLEHLARERDEELHRGKLAFFTNITHEFRTPLTLILGPLEDLRQRVALEPALVSRIDGIERNARRLLELVNRVLTFRKLASRHGSLHAYQLDLTAFVRLTALAFQSEAQRQEVTLTCTMDPVEAWADPDKIEIILSNLLNNALKFTPPGGRIAVRVSSRHNWITLEVADDGPGIPENLRGQVFERFFGGDSTGNPSGSGIGLAFTRELVELHRGTIEITETPGGGATFTVRLPRVQHESVPLPTGYAVQKVALDLALGNLETEELAGCTAPLLDLSGVEQSDLVAPRTADPRETVKPHLLIVEDHPELSAYLGELFRDEYSLSFASNGVEGLAAARGPNPPQLIVSDVMMPEMDGMAMCTALKSELATSHIPILLLTARTGELAALEGLRTGADDYLEKPFQPEELRLRVRNVLATRARARATFTRVVRVEPSEISTTHPDERFLSDALQAVEDHIDEVDYSVITLASDLNVSRALLFSKMKALIDLTPGNFIKQVRLKRATQLLEAGAHNVSEVAYAVGFRDPKYFNKCFREAYTVAPSKWVGRDVSISNDSPSVVASEYGSALLCDPKGFAKPCWPQGLNPERTGFGASLLKDDTALAPPHSRL